MVCTLVKATLPIILMGVFLFFLLDYYKLRVWRYRYVGDKEWFIAFSQYEVNEMTKDVYSEVIAPEKPLIIRLWRRLHVWR